MMDRGLPIDNIHFMKELGTSPKNYILSYQLKVAGQLVTNSDLPIREIASACGFSSSASFAQQFYRTYGRSPPQVPKY